MDLLERLFGFAPDGGNGTAELMLFVIVMALVVFVVQRRRQASPRRQ